MFDNKQEYAKSMSISMLKYRHLNWENIKKKSLKVHQKLSTHSRRYVQGDYWKRELIIKNQETAYFDRTVFSTCFNRTNSWILKYEAIFMRSPCIQTTPSPFHHPIPLIKSELTSQVGWNAVAR